MKNFALITEGFGHGFACVNLAKVANLTPVAFSMKDTKEAFTAEVEQIFNNLSAFAPEMVKACWEERDTYHKNGWDIRADLLAGKITDEMWQAFATGKLTLADENRKGLPQFNGLAEDDNILFIPQKLKSDGHCGITAEQQSLPLEVFYPLQMQEGHQLVLGQHFHKVNDRDSVVELAKDFNLYVPGLTENEEVFGIRGVQHIKYWNLYRQLSGSIGIAGTHTWYMLTCFPEVPQIILFNKNGVEDWKGIEKAYQAAGRQILCIGFDDKTNLQQLSEEIMNSANRLF